MEESFVFHDYTDDLEGYAEIVAVLNAQADEQISMFHQDDTGMSLYAVLCRTKGQKLEVMPAGLVHQVAGPRNCYTLYYESLDAAEAAAAWYEQSEEMLYAELDAEVTALSEQEEISHSFHSWGASRMNFGSYLSHAGKWGKDESVVAVIDSGVCRHSLLDGKVTESGYDYIDADDDATNDTFGHGTHVAGIVADCTYGVPVWIYPIRVLNGAGSGKISNVVNAIMEAIEKNVDVINLSIESRVMSDAMDDAIFEALDENIVVVVAAGNSSCDTKDICPAHLENEGVLVVGAAEISGESCVRASYSNYGDSVDVYAFGTNISSCSRTGGYVSGSGTSVAAPHISALCAMLRFIHPGMPPAMVEQRTASAAQIGGSVCVPDIGSMVPVSEGFLLRTLALRNDEEVHLPTVAVPATSREGIEYSSSDLSVVSVEDGVLKAVGTGRATITVSCTGFDDTSFEVVVEEEDGNGGMNFPDSLKVLEDEACAGNVTVEKIVLPEGLIRIGDNVFEGCTALRMVHIPSTVSEMGINSFADAVIICRQSSAAYLFCKENGVQYIADQ